MRIPIKLQTPRFEKFMGLLSTGLGFTVQTGKLDHIKQGPVIWVDCADSQPCIGTAGSVTWFFKATGKLFHSGARREPSEPTILASPAPSRPRTLDLDPRPAASDTPDDTEGVGGSEASGTPAKLEATPEKVISGLLPAAGAEAAMLITDLCSLSMGSETPEVSSPWSI